MMKGKYTRTLVFSKSVKMFFLIPLKVKMVYFSRNKFQRKNTRYAPDPFLVSRLNHTIQHPQNDPSILSELNIKKATQSKDTKF